MPFYAALLELGDRKDLVMMKSTSDPAVDTSWSSENGLIRMTDLVDGLWAHLDGTDIHVATLEASTGRMEYHKFSTTSDTWTITKELIFAPSNTGVATGISLSVRSDGDVIVLYTTHDGTIHRVNYARRESAVWTTEIQVDNGGANGWRSSCVVKGSSDRMHFAFWSNSLHYQRTLRSDNTLETFPSSFASGISVAGQPTAYVSGADTKVRIPFRDVAGKAAVAKFDSADTPTITEDLDISEALIDVETQGRGEVVAAADGTTLHLLFIDQATDDLFHDNNADDGGWGTDIEELDAVTVNRISCNVYDRDGTVLAFVYDDGGTTKYQEIDRIDPDGGLMVGGGNLLGIGL